MGPVTLVSRKMSLKRGTGCWGLVIRMDDSDVTSLEQFRAWLAGGVEVRFAGLRRAEARSAYRLRWRFSTDRFAADGALEGFETVAVPC